jgi:hypothetical protein
MTHTDDTWSLTIEPEPGNASGATLMSWGFSGVLLLLGAAVPGITIIGEGVSWWYWIIALAFPLLITFYAGQSVQGVGTLTITRDGISIQKAGSEHTPYAWADIDTFVVGDLGTIPIIEAQGAAVPHMMLKSMDDKPRRVGLSGATRFSAEELVTGLNALLDLSRNAWPKTPKLFEDAIAIGRHRSE